MKKRKRFGSKMESNDFEDLVFVARYDLRAFRSGVAPPTLSRVLEQLRMDNVHTLGQLKQR
jgi:hypothetical protein